MVDLIVGLCGIGTQQIVKIISGAIVVGALNDFCLYWNVCTVENLNFPVAELEQQLTCFQKVSQHYSTRA